MKEKTITIKTNEISQRQYSTLLLELNIMKQQWRSFGVHLNISAPSLKKIIALGTTNGSDINYDQVNETHTAIDLIYNPAQTMFLKKCQKKCANTLNGHEMLINQALESWEIWKI